MESSEEPSKENAVVKENTKNSATFDLGDGSFSWTEHKIQE